MAFFLRSATLQIGPLKYNMNDGFYFDFEVPFYDSDQLITASFTVYNLNPTSRQGIVKNQVVILNAGIVGALGLGIERSVSITVDTGQVSQRLSQSEGRVP